MMRIMQSAKRLPGRGRRAHHPLHPGRLLVAGLLVLGLAAVAPPTGQAQQGEPLVLCLDPVNMPYSGRGELPPGFDMEIGRLLGRHIGRQVEVYWANTGSRGGMGKALRLSIADGRCNAFMGVPHAPQMEEDLQEKRLVLTEPYLAVGEVLVVRKGAVDRFKDLSDLRNVSIGLQAGTLGHAIAIRQKLSDRELYDESAQVVEAVANGEVQAGLLFGPMAGWALQQGDYPDVVISRGFEMGSSFTYPLGIAVRREDEALRKALNRAINELKQEEALQSILGKYGGPFTTGSAVSKAD